MVYLFIYIFIACMFVTVSQEMINLFIFYMINHSIISSLLINNLPTKMFIVSLFFLMFIIACIWLAVYKKWSLYLFVTLLSSYIQLISWSITYFDLYVNSLHFNYFSWYIRVSFTKSDFFVLLWNDHHLISSLLNAIVLDYIFNFCFNFNYFSKYVVGWVIKHSIFVCFWNDYYRISSSLIDSLQA